MKFLKIKETCLYFKDLDVARHFYHAVLGLPIIHHQAGKHIFFRVGSSVLLCFNPEDSGKKTSPPPHYGVGKLHLAFEVPEKEYAAARAEIESKGIRIIEEATWPGGHRSFYFEDPDGNVLEILPDRGIWD